MLEAADCLSSCAGGITGKEPGLRVWDRASRASSLNVDPSRPCVTAREPCPLSRHCECMDGRALAAAASALKFERPTITEPNAAPGGCA